MHIFLETERLALRRFTETDVDNLVDLDSDPDVMRYISGGRPTPREQIQTDFRLVRTFRQSWPYPIPGDEYGDVEYALTRSDWELLRRAIGGSSRPPG
jgi:RimJ/RimL family protein N-acetyltransferase